MCLGDQRGKVFLLFSQGQDSSLAPQVKGKGRGRCLKLLLAGTSYGQTKMPFCAGTEEVNTFLFKLNILIF